jgi:hypothetical protein
LLTKVWADDRAKGWLSPPEVDLSDEPEALELFIEPLVEPLLELEDWLFLSSGLALGIVATLALWCVSNNIRHTTKTVTAPSNIYL